MAVQKHVGIWRLHKAVLYFSDNCVIKAVPRPGETVEARSCVVAHVQMTCMVLEKEGKKKVQITDRVEPEFISVSVISS